MLRGTFANPLSGFRTSGARLDSLIAPVLPNVIFLLLRPFIFLHRPLLNVDYFVVAMAASLLPVSASAAAFMCVLVIDILFSVSGAYHFKLQDAIRGIGELGTLSPVALLPIIGLLLVTTFVAAHVLTTLRQRDGKSLRLQLATLLVLSALQATVFAFSHNENRTAIAGSGLLNWLQAVVDEIRPLAPQPAVSATKPVFDEVRANGFANENLAVVVVESLGLPFDPSFSRWVFAPLQPLDRKYRVKYGTVAFEGSTVPGELRELCQVKNVGLRVTSTSDTLLQACLPNLLRRQGFTTIAIHGFKKDMFERERWYPRIGFQESYFKENWPSPNPHICGLLFDGICDSDSGALFRQKLITGGKEKQFVYWLTLQSHLEIEQRDASNLNSRCEREISADISGELCILAHSSRQVMERVAEAAMDPALPKTRFIIVGDHSPPFILLEKRSKFSKAQVPFVELTPR